MLGTIPDLADLLNKIHNADSDTSIATLLAQIEHNPGDARLFFLLGAEHAENNQFDAAEAAYICALNRAPDFSIARFQLGLLQYVQQRVATALANWEPLLILPREHFLHVFVLAFEALVKQEQNKAIDLFKEGMELNKENPPLNANIDTFIRNTLRKSANNGTENTSANSSESEIEDDASALFQMSAYREH